MGSKITKGLLGVALLVLGIQLVPTGGKINPAVDESRTMQARSAAPPEVRSILYRACGDCHSNQTRWPWYSRVAPVSWLLANHVKEGRRELNLSDWQLILERGPERASKKLDVICREVKGGKMPLKSYLLLHRDAQLSADDVTAVCGWTASEKLRLASR